jgi:uncharacterized membrane protein YbhN (UPF0104 family)
MARVPTEALIYRALLPMLSTRTGTEAYFSQNFAGLVLPPPTNSVVLYAYFRNDGIDKPTSLIGAVGSFIFPTAGRLALPLVAIVPLVIAGDITNEALVIVGFCVFVLLVITVMLWVIGRSDGSARALGDWMGGVVSWLLARVHRGPVTGFGDLLVNFRTSTYSIVAKRWPAGTFAVSLNLLLTYFMVLLSLRFVGLSSSDISGVEVFASFAVSFFAGAVFPITGSGLGTVDVVMISALTTFTGNASLSTAGEFLWRTFYSFITVPFGVFTLNRFRREHGELITESWTALGEMRQGQGASPGTATVDELQEPDAV